MRHAIFLLAICACTFWNEPAEADTEPYSPSFLVGPLALNVPEGYLVLVRKGSDIGAFRIVDIKRDSSGNLGSSRYESYFRGKGNDADVQAREVSRVGEINVKHMRGIHAFAWQPGKDRLWIGKKWWFGCYTPSLVNMSSGFSETDTGYEFAPTASKNIAEIDWSGKQYKWYRFDPNSTVRVWVSELPDGKQKKEHDRADPTEGRAETR